MKLNKKSVTKRQKAVPLNICVIDYGDREEIQLYILDRGQQLVIVQASKLQVLSEIAKLYNVICYDVPHEMKGMDKDAAIQEAQRILDGRQ